MSDSEANKIVTNTDDEDTSEPELDLDAATKRKSLPASCGSALDWPMVEGSSNARVHSEWAMTARRVLAVCLLAPVMGSIVGCVPIGFPLMLPENFYTENRTVDVPSLKPAADAWTSSPWRTDSGTIFDSGEPFHFTDPRPRVLIIGHVQVRRDDNPREAVGIILFEADDYEDNLVSLFENKSETVNFVSGNWFAGKIFAGKRSILKIGLADQPGDFGFERRYRRCGRSIWAGVHGWDFRLNMDDATKAYYLGHITIYETPRESFWGVHGYIRVEVRDRADEFADSLRAFVGDRGIEKALLPNCPE